MNLSVRFCLVPLLPVLLFTGCEDKGKNVVKKELPVVNWRADGQSDFEEKVKIVSPVLRAVFDKKFDRLEKMASVYRDERTRTQGGDFALSVFYSAFEDYPDWNRVNAEKYYPVLLERIEQWRKEYPDSPTPHVALAAYHVGHAWHARGGGYSDTVSDEGWKLFGERLGKAMDVLLEQSEIVTKDPHSYCVMLTAFRGVGVERDRMNLLFLETLAVEPKYWENYYQLSIYHLPRWNGETHKEWHEKLVAALDEAKLEQEDQDEIYAMVTMCVIDFAYDEDDEPNAFEVCGINWERLQRGAGIALKKYPKSTGLPKLYQRVAKSAGKEDETQKVIGGE